LSIAEVNIGKKAANEIILQQLASSIILGDQSGIKKEVNHALHAGIPACNILNKGMIQGMTVLGRMFRDNEVYVSQVIMASQAMEAGLKILKPFLSEFHLSYKGKVVIGTIQYDIHDLGKNIVGIFLESSGFKVLDLGVDVPTESFVQAVEKERPDLLAICAMMTTTLPYMQEVVEAVRQSPAGKGLKILVGGLPVTPRFARSIGVDAYGVDAVVGNRTIRGRDHQGDGSGDEPRYKLH
jgi:5-methyltetrahydrofolate--homocysteine methyltransferase